MPLSSSRQVGNSRDAVQKRASRKFEAGFSGTEASVRVERHCISAVAFMVAGGGFESPTFGLCDLTHISMRVGLYLTHEGCSPSSIYAFPPSPWAWYGISQSLHRHRLHRHCRGFLRN